MPDNITIKQGIKLGLGFSIGSAIFHVLDKGVGKALAPYSRMLIDKIIETTKKDRPQPDRSNHPSQGLRQVRGDDV